MNKTIIYKNIAVVFLWVMSIQYIPLEGYGVSNLKFSLMCASPLIWILSYKTFSKGFILGLLFIVSIIFSSLYNEQAIRFSSLGYKIAFIVMFITYYDLIYVRQALQLETFKRFIKNLIYAYAICLIIQQLFIIIGLIEFPLINLVTFIGRGIGANSLSLEPSHSARILTVAMLVLLRLEEVSKPEINVTYKSFYRNNKILLLLFLWCMLTMGSGTAFIGLLILSSYFIKRQYFLRLLPILLLIAAITLKIYYEPLERAINTIVAITTLDVNYIKTTDYSAAARIVPLINTIKFIDFTEISTWLGNGIDTNINALYLSEEQFIGGINDYGFICFLFSLFLFFGCCTKKIFSIETLAFVVLLSASINNVAYNWCILLLFTTSKYFIDKSPKKVKPIFLK
ncbi:hypothetical protein N9H50_00685 [bacterium]|nr:hypothetical protein [bacterium]